MHRIEQEEFVDCAACGATIDPGSDRVFALGAEEDFLCWECAAQHGGTWEDVLQLWSTDPDLRGLLRIPSNAKGQPVRSRPT